MVWVRERTIPTERPPFVGEVIANFCGWRVPRGQRDGSLRPYSRFSRQEPLLFYEVAPQLYSGGWVGPVPEPLLSFSSGSAGNRTQDPWICSQELWPLDQDPIPKKTLFCCFLNLVTMSSKIEKKTSGCFFPPFDVNCSIIEKLLRRKSSGSGLDNREYDRRDQSRWPRGSLYQKTLALTSPTSCWLTDPGHGV
jgi:hypothetical protein